MGTFKAYFKKEVIESIRQYRYIVLGVGIIVFAILDPIMLKLLPTILKGQMPQGVDLSTMFVVTQKTALQNYVKDLFQTGNLFITLSLMGILSDEIGFKRLIYPYSKGGNPWGIVLAKTLHYSIVVLLFIIMGFLLNYYYATLLFKGDGIKIYNIILSALLVSLYYVFNISLIVFFSSVFKKGISAAIVVLVISYFTPLALNLKVLVNFIPYRLVSEANLFGNVSSNLWITILFVAISSIVLNIVGIWRMNKVEVV